VIRRDYEENREGFGEEIKKKRPPPFICISLEVHTNFNYLYESKNLNKIYSKVAPKKKV